MLTCNHCMKTLASLNTINSHRYQHCYFQHERKQLKRRLNSNQLQQFLLPICNSPSLESTFEIAGVRTLRCALDTRDTAIIEFVSIDCMGKGNDQSNVVTNDHHSSNG